MVSYEMPKFDRALYSWMLKGMERLSKSNNPGDILELESILRKETELLNNIETTDVPGMKSTYIHALEAIRAFKAKRQLV
jgi:hypothetical protein